MLYLYPLPRTVEEILERLKVLPSDHKRSQTLPRANFKNHHLDNESNCLSVTKSEYGKNLGAKKGQRLPKALCYFRVVRLSLISMLSYKIEMFLFISSMPLHCKACTCVYMFAYTCVSRVDHGYCCHHFITFQNLLICY